MEPTRDLRLTNTMAIQFPYRAGLSRRGSRSPQALPLLPGLSQSGANPFAQDLALELGNTASRPAMARPMGVVRSSASVNDTNPTPRWLSSWSVATRSATDRPQRSRRHTSTTSISRRRAASNTFSRSSRWDAPEPTSFTCTTMLQPRRAAYSRMTRLCKGRVCWSWAETRA